jgi:hypothetical protein
MDDATAPLTIPASAVALGSAAADIAGGGGTKPAGSAMATAVAGHGRVRWRQDGLRRRVKRMCLANAAAARDEGMRLCSARVQVFEPEKMALVRAVKMWILFTCFTVGVAQIIRAYNRVHMSSYRVSVSPAVVIRHELTQSLTWHCLSAAAARGPPPYQHVGYYLGEDCNTYVYFPAVLN